MSPCTGTLAFTETKKTRMYRTVMYRNWDLYTAANSVEKSQQIIPNGHNFLKFKEGVKIF
jgi:hypothetical protein